MRHTGMTILILTLMAVVAGCKSGSVIGTLVHVVELAVWAGSSGAQSFTQWFWKYSVFTLWLPALAYLIVYVVHGRIESRKLFPTSSKETQHIDPER